MSPSLKIIQCFRAPVGGLFRHVLDLTRAQAQRGHRIGIICDAATGGAAAEAALDAIAPFAQLGVRRIAMSRDAGIADIGATRATHAFARETGADVLHGHGAKGGAYARLAATTLRRRGTRVAAFYTPHGGSLHYDRNSLKGRAFLGLERLLIGASDGLIFESDFSRQAFEAKVGPTLGRARVIHNGLLASEFETVIPDQDAADFLFVGELRHLKGVDLLIDVLAALTSKQRDGIPRVRAVIVGDGPDAQSFRQQAADRGLDGRDVVFAGARPARAMFGKGRCLVVPSRAESFPYIVLEAAAAGLPMIVTRVGGIPEIYGGLANHLIAADSLPALTAAMTNFLEAPGAAATVATALRDTLKERFTVDHMAERILATYFDGLTAINQKRVGSSAYGGRLPETGTDHA